MKTFRCYRFKTTRSIKNCLNCAHSFDVDIVLNEKDIVYKAYASCDLWNIDVFGARKFRCSEWLHVKGYIGHFRELKKYIKDPHNTDTKDMS